MRISFRIVAASVTLALTALVAHAHDTSWPAKKLDALIPGAKFVARKYALKPDAVKAIESYFLKDDPNGKMTKEDLAGTAYVASGKDETTGKTVTTGVVFFVDPIGTKGKMEMGVSVDAKGKLLAVRIFEHKEGKALNDKAFLKQFVDKTTKDPFRVAEDVKADADDAKSAQAVATSAKKMLLILEAAFGKGAKPASEAAKESATSSDGK